MPFDEQSLFEQNNSLKTQLQTAREQNARLQETVRTTCETLGARMKADGSADIDFEKFVERLGMAGALEVRAIIDEKYGISGAAGEKPRVKIKAAAA